MFGPLVEALRKALVDSTVGQDGMTMLTIAEHAKEAGTQVSSATPDGQGGWDINLRSKGRRTTRLRHLTSRETAAIIGTLGPPRERPTRRHR